VEKATRYRDDAGLHLFNSTSSSVLGSVGAFVHDYGTNLQNMTVIDAAGTSSFAAVAVSWVQPEYWVEARFEWDGTSLKAWFKRLQTGATIGPYTFTPTGLSDLSTYNYMVLTYYNGLNQAGSGYLAGVWIGDITEDWPTW